jgi:hypothetical protein
VAVGVEDIGRFIDDLGSTRTSGYVKTYDEPGGVNGTPTFFINGVRHEGL